MHEQFTSTSTMFLDLYYWILIEYWIPVRLSPSCNWALGAEKWPVEYWSIDYTGEEIFIQIKYILGAEQLWIYLWSARLVTKRKEHRWIKQMLWFVERQMYTAICALGLFSINLCNLDFSSLGVQNIISVTFSIWSAYISSEVTWIISY